MQPEIYVPLLALIATIGAAFLASRATKATGEIGQLVSGWKDISQDRRQEMIDTRTDRDHWRTRALAAEAELEKLRRRR